MQDFSLRPAIYSISHLAPGSRTTPYPKISPRQSPWCTPQPHQGVAVDSLITLHTSRQSMFSLPLTEVFAVCLTSIEENKFHVTWVGLHACFVIIHACYQLLTCVAIWFSLETRTSINLVIIAEIKFHQHQLRYPLPKRQPVTRRGTKKQIFMCTKNLYDKLSNISVHLYYILAGVFANHGYFWGLLANIYSHIIYGIKVPCVYT